MIDHQECNLCEDEVLTLSSRGWCDGCEQEAEHRSVDNETIRTMVRRGHRTTDGRNLAIHWAHAPELRTGDVLAGLQAATNGFQSTNVANVLNHREYAVVTRVDTDDVNTEIDVTTRMNLWLTREWRNRAQLPVLVLTSSGAETVSASGQPLDSPSTARDDSTTTTTRENI